MLLFLPSLFCLFIIFGIAVREFCFKKVDADQNITEVEAQPQVQTNIQSPSLPNTFEEISPVVVPENLEVVVEGSKNLEVVVEGSKNLEVVVEGSKNLEVEGSKSPDVQPAISNEGLKVTN